MLHFSFEVSFCVKMVVDAIIILFTWEGLFLVKYNSNYFYSIHVLYILILTSTKTHACMHKCSGTSTRLRRKDTTAARTSTALVI